MLVLVNGTNKLFFVFFVLFYSIYLTFFYICDDSLWIVRKDVKLLVLIFVERENWNQILLYKVIGCVNYWRTRKRLQNKYSKKRLEMSFLPWFPLVWWVQSRPRPWRIPISSLSSGHLICQHNYITATLLFSQQFEPRNMKSVIFWNKNL